MTDAAIGVEMRAARIRMSETNSLIDINFSVAAGVHAIIGANGSGKSTLMRRMAAVVADGVDALRWDGADALALTVPERTRMRAAILSEARPVVDYTCLEFVAIAVPDKSSRQRLARAQDMLQSLGSARLAEQSVRTVSAGEWAWIRLAQAAVTMPNVLFVDEIDAAVSEADRLRLYAVLRETARTVVAVSHDMAGVTMWADSVWELSGGQLRGVNR